MDTNMNRLLSLTEASQQFGISVPSLRKAVTSGKLAYFRPLPPRGKIWLTVEDIQQFLNRSGVLK